MKLIFSLFLCMAAVSAASAQVPVATPPAGTGKIGIVNPLQFTEDKEGSGITRLKTAVKSVNDALKPLTDKIQSDSNRLRSIAAEIERLRGVANTPPNTINAKIVEGQDLEKSIKRSDEDYKAQYDRRYRQTVAPVFDDILRAMNDFAKQNGYAIILNGPKLEQDDLLMGFDERYDVTANFIKFFNVRPVSAPR